LGGSWFVGAFEALTLKPPALPEDTYFYSQSTFLRESVPERTLFLFSPSAFLASNNHVVKK
uniref:hypothetical protein n=1 Tax=Phytobacter sp. V91 TaxID=3369425 RepID=UPI003F5F4D73